MEFRVLGPFEVRAGGTIVQLGGPKARAVLAALLLRANEVVPTAALVDAVWGIDAPVRAVPTLHSYVSRLRTALAVESGPRILSRHGGYQLQVAPGELDADTFRRDVARATVAEDLGDVDAARALLRSSLDLWRGPALANMPSAVLRGHAASLDKARLIAVEQLLALDLYAGRHTELVPELRSLCSAHPTRERLAGLLMRALYRGGQQADALQVFRDTREALVRDLGIEPGPELQRLQRQILSNDPVLGTGAVATRQLPRDVADFTGRTTETAHVLRAIQPGGPSIVAINGMAGVGKTALAVHVSHRVATDFPDGQLFLDLHAHTPGQRPREVATALELLLCAIGVPRSAVPDQLDLRVAMWRTETSGRRALLVLDNVADTAQVRPLLPGSGVCAVLVTSRYRLVDLDGALPVSLDPLPSEDAATLFTRIVGGRQDPDVVREAVRACGHLPLAIRIAAARLRHRPSWDLQRLTTRLHDDGRRLGTLDFHGFGVPTAFARSYHQLGAEEQRLFRLLGLYLPRDFDAHVAAAMAGIPLANAERLLDLLVDAHVLDEPASGRFRFHDLMRTYAADRVVADEPPADQMAAEHRALDYYLHTQHNLYHTRFPGSMTIPLGTLAAGVQPRVFRSADDALTWREHERKSFVSSHLGGPAYGFEVPTREVPWERWSQSYRELHVLGRMVSTPLPLGATGRRAEWIAQARLLNDLGVHCEWLGRSAESVVLHGKALALYRRLGDGPGEAATLVALGLGHRRDRRYGKAAECYRRALDIFRGLDSDWGQGSTLNRLAAMHLTAGEHEDAVVHGRRAVAVLQEAGERRDLAAALSTLGRTLDRLADAQGAEDCWRRALTIFDECDPGAAGNLRQYLRSVSGRAS